MGHCNYRRVVTLISLYVNYFKTKQSPRPQHALTMAAEVSSKTITCGNTAESEL